MTFDEFKAIVLPLSLALGAEFDYPTWRLYHRALENVPAVLLGAAVTKAAETRTKMPSAAQIREMAEEARKALLAAHPYDASDCESCNGTGWEPIMVENVKRVTRCGCWRMWQARLTQLGVSTTPLSLPAGRDTGFERVGDFDAA